MDKADALAQLSEGWCPVCHTAFKVCSDEVPRCGSGIPLERVRAEIENPRTVSIRREYTWVMGDGEIVVMGGGGGGGGLFSAGGAGGGSYVQQAIAAQYVVTPSTNIIITDVMS